MYEQGMPASPRIYKRKTNMVHFIPTCIDSMSSIIKLLLLFTVDNERLISSKNYRACTETHERYITKIQ